VRQIVARRAIVAALNLILDFDFVETGVHARAPKYMEWYGVFGINGHTGVDVYGDLSIAG
jgi:uncharacterized YccA/Bax inhibitor family protein